MVMMQMAAYHNRVIDKQSKRIGALEAEIVQLREDLTEAAGNGRHLLHQLEQSHQENTRLRELLARCVGFEPQLDVEIRAALTLGP